MADTWLYSQKLALWLWWTCGKVLCCHSIQQGGHPLQAVQCTHQQRIVCKVIKIYFKQTFRRSANPHGKLFLQDGDPSKNSRHAKRPMDRIGVRVFNIPPRSPDCNPIENVFNVVKQQLHQQALEREIIHKEL